MVRRLRDEGAHMKNPFNWAWLIFPALLVAALLTHHDAAPSRAEWHRIQQDIIDQHKETELRKEIDGYKASLRNP